MAVVSEMSLARIVVGVGFERYRLAGSVMGVVFREFEKPTEPKKQGGRAGDLRPSHIFSKFSGTFIIGLTLVIL